MVRALDENFVPYAPKKPVLDVIKRYRERGLPDPITTTVLEQVGVSSTMTSVTLQALVFLRLVDEGGNRMETFERLRMATSTEYQQALGEIVRKAYLNVFTIVDPTKDDDVAVADAFRRYEPPNQREKMIRLFIGLCEEAGIVEPEKRSNPIPRPRVKREEPASTRSEKRTVQVQTDGTKESSIRDSDQISPDYRLISAVIQQLPREGHWTVEKRERWLKAITSAVDLLIETREKTGAVEQGDKTP